MHKPCDLREGDKVRCKMELGAPELVGKIITIRTQTVNKWGDKLVFLLGNEKAYLRSRFVKINV